jgi:hypothetical protein
MKRFSLSEVNFQRVTSALLRRVLDIPHAWAWSLSIQAYQNRERLSHFKDIHAGKRCFILGNGPSLAKMDLTPLKDEFTFGANRIYLLFNETDFRPTYYVSINELVLQQFADDIKALPFPKFLNWSSRFLFGKRDDIFYLRIKPNLFDSFTKDITRPISSGGTVTFVALQLAYYMGFSEVILIGVDHNFVDKGTPNLTATRMADRDINHFHPNYFPKGYKWQFPDLVRSEIAYQLARHVFETSGRRIVDATIGGQCPVFEKVEWTAIFG